MTITPGRLVAFLTPLIFAPLAGSISVLAARHLPGVDIDQGRLQGIFIAGATIAFGKAALWLKGWQDWEKREADAPADIGDLPLDHAEGHDDSGLDQATAVAEDAGAEEEPMQEDPIEEEDPVDGEEPDFDDGDLDDLLAAPVAAGNEG
jgi:hypothetical protein